MKQPRYTDNRQGRYYTAAESKKEGYLRRRFAEIERGMQRDQDSRAQAQREAEAETALKVKPIKAKVK